MVTETEAPDCVRPFLSGLRKIGSSVEQRTYRVDPSAPFADQSPDLRRGLPYPITLFDVAGGGPELAEGPNPGPGVPGSESRFPTPESRVPGKITS